MVVKIEVPFGALSIIRHLMDMVPKKRLILATTHMDLIGTDISNNHHMTSIPWVEAFVHFKRTSDAYYRFMRSYKTC